MLSLTELAAQRRLIFDGGMGTTIQRLDIPEEAWAGAPGNNELLCITAPEVITDIHRSYFRAGADVAVTNSFGANRIVLAEYNMADRAAELTRAAVQRARNAAAEFDTKFVALSVGPGSKLPTLGYISYDALYNAYLEQMQAGSGADLIIIETCQDLLQIKAAVAAAMTMDKPVMVSFTLEENGATLTGSDIACIGTVLGGYDLFALGINCSFGPDMMRAPLEALSKVWGGRLYLSPNAGMPELRNGVLTYPAGAEEFAAECVSLAETFDLNIVGGCCGTRYEHIAALVNALPQKTGRTPSREPVMKGYAASAFTSMPLRQIPPPALIGERANGTGSRLFRDKLKDGDYAGMASIAASQEGSAHIIDLSVSYSGFDEKKEMAAVLPLLNPALTAPLMIDSVSPEVIETALKLCTGKPVVNSVNLEDGGTKLHNVLNMISKHPACAVALAIDEAGMARSTEDKLRIARRLYCIWTEEYGFQPEDLLLDLLTFPVSTGDEDATYAAVNTLEAIRLFSQEFPRANLVLGVSNVSFGLMPRGRVVLNSVFLHMAVERGLSAAIVHAEKVLPYAMIPERELELSTNLLEGKDGALDAFIAHFSSAEPEAEVVTNLPPEQMLYNRLLKGNSADLAEIINTLLDEKPAKEILSDILMPAMDEVGKLFGEGKLLLPFVLRSAEVMRQSADVLSPHLKGESTGKRGKLVLATVAGDVHDIGKNLVDIILTGNGYDVVNMGTKIPGGDIVAAAREHNADAVGMSGLLVKSVEIMRNNVALLKDAGLDLKVLLGGAALTADFVERECEPLMPGKVYYCKDVFSGLSAMQGFLPTAPRQRGGPEAKIQLPPPFEGTVNAPFTGASEVLTPSLEDILPFLGKKSLFEGRWGYRKGADMPDPEKELAAMLREIKDIAPKAVYGYFSQGPEHTDRFAEHFKSAGAVPMQFVTLGNLPEKIMTGGLASGKYSRYYQYHGLFAELTEALADFVTARVEAELGVKVRRYSFGYPACPDLEGNREIEAALNAGRIGVSINEGLQIEPVYSTAAFAILSGRHTRTL